MKRKTEFELKFSHWQKTKIFEFNISSNEKHEEEEKEVQLKTKITLPVNDDVKELKETRELKIKIKKDIVKKKKGNKKKQKKQ